LEQVMGCCRMGFQMIVFDGGKIMQHFLQNRKLLAMLWLSVMVWPLFVMQIVAGASTSKFLLFMGPGSLSNIITPEKLCYWGYKEKNRNISFVCASVSAKCHLVTSSGHCTGVTAMWMD